MTPSDGAARSADPELLLRDQRWLVALARSLVGDEHAAEDVVQEARIAAWLHAPGDPGRAGGWLRRVVRNLSIRVRRSDARRNLREQVAAPREATPATDELVARVQMQRAVAEAVLALDEPYRSAILLRFFDRLPPRDIAARLGAPVETVRTRLKRALEQLRVKLDRDFGARDTWATLLLPWTTVATATTKVGLKLAVAAVLIGSAGVATWEGTRRASMRANEGGAQIAAATAVAPKEASRSIGGDADAAAAEGAARIEESAAHRPRPIVGFEHVHLTARIVDETARTPIAGAKFTASYWRAPGRAEASAVADVDGRIVLDYGPAESNNFEYFVAHADHARLDGYQTLDEPISRSAGERLVEHDFGELALERGAAVSGRVVRLPDRTAVADATLFLLSGRGVPTTDFQPLYAREIGRSRRDGSFEVGERLGARGFAPVIYAATPTGLGWVEVTVAKGRERIEGLELVIEPSARLDVLVVDESDNPIEGAAVRALPRSAPLGPESWITEVDFPRFGAPILDALFSATTDRDGGVSLPYLPEERSYSVFARAKLGRRRMAVAWKYLGRNAKESMKLTLRRSVPLAIRGRIADERGAPIANARVELNRSASSTSGDTGSYELPPAPCGEQLEFHVSATGFGQVEQKLFDSKLGDRIVPIRGADGAVEREELVVDFVLECASTIAGRCIDGAGDGVANVTVDAHRFDDAHDSWMLRRATTAADGRFKFDQTTPGDWALQIIMAPGSFRRNSRRTVEAGTQDVEFRLLPPSLGHARLVVDVVDAETKLAAEVVNAVVSPMHSGVSGPACAFAVGSVTADRLTVGAWRISIQGVDGRVANHEFEVTDSTREIRLTAELGVTASFDGHVAFADGRPPPSDHQLMVWLRASANQYTNCGHAIDREGHAIAGITDSCANVEADGTFRLRGVSPGVAIRAYIDEPSACGESVITLAPGEHGHIELQLESGAELTFRVAESLAPGCVTLEIAREGGRYAFVEQCDSPRRGDEVVRDFMTPGMARWRATYVNEEDELPRPRTVEGDLEVVSGHPEVVDIRGLK